MHVVAIVFCAIGTAGVAFMLVFLYKCSAGPKHSIRAHLVFIEPPAQDTPGGLDGQGPSTHLKSKPRQALSNRESDPHRSTVLSHPGRFAQSRLSCAANTPRQVRRTE